MTKQLGLLEKGKAQSIWDLTDTDASGDAVFQLLSDSIVVSVFARSVSPGGSLGVEVFTSAPNATDTQVQIIEFPELTTASTELLLRKAALTMGSVKIRYTVTGTVDFVVWAKAIDGADSTVSLSGFTSARASSATVGTSAQEILAGALSDREGLVLKNNSTSGTLYLGFAASEATLGNGYPIPPQGEIAIDLGAGESLWGIGDASIDVRIIEGG